MDNGPLVTVGIPVYNGEDNLAQAIESIRIKPTPISRSLFQTTRHPTGRSRSHWNWPPGMHECGTTVWKGMSAPTVISNG